jgi:hypothetical protein
MNTYAVSIQWADGLSMSVVEAQCEEHALGIAIVTNKDRRFPISDFVVVAVGSVSELTS